MMSVKSLSHLVKIGLFGCAAGGDRSGRQQLQLKRTAERRANSAADPLVLIGVLFDHHLSVITITIGITTHHS
jgi:hypothetical protein